MFEWEDYFEPHILERGWRYAKGGAVHNLVKHEGKVEAIVAGSEYYKVSISRAGKAINKAYCSCPYAASGSWCKHMAAVLYEADQYDAGYDKVPDSRTLLPEAEEEPLPSLTQMIYEADRSLLENVLIELADSDEKTESRIRTMLAGSVKRVNSAGIKEMEKEIEQIFLTHADRGGFINYYNAIAFADDLERYLENQSGSLLDEEEYLPAFELTAYAYIRLGNCDIDDDGEITQIGKACYKIWQRIIAECPSDVKKQIREWFVRHSEDGSVPDYMEDLLQDFLKYELATAEELEAQLKSLDALIEAGKDSTRCQTIYTSYYGYSVEAISLRILLMERLGRSAEEIDAFRRAHFHFQSVRDYYLKQAREAGNIEEEIRILNESKTLDRDSDYLVHSYSKRLIELYQIQENRDREKAERREAFLSYQPAASEEFREYRALCTEEEWPSERKILIASRARASQRCELLAEEKMLPELYEEILKEGGELQYFNKYGFLLAEMYGEQILNVYKDYVILLADDARSRTAYDELSRYLMRMREYAGGEELVRELCREWIEKYPTRKVMIKELSRFCY